LSAPRLYRCQECGKSYRHSGSLVNHRRTHQTGDFPCPHCPKRFPNLGALRGHLRGHRPRGPRHRD
ncbi:ZN646 protein, partial [Rostratula benghalensis]|nr:ZN646 protein [Rostratula benghalensis]